MFPYHHLCNKTQQRVSPPLYNLSPPVGMRSVRCTIIAMLSHCTSQGPNRKQVIHSNGFTWGLVNELFNRGLDRVEGLMEG